MKVLIINNIFYFMEKEGGIMVIETNSERETLEYGRKCGADAMPGDIICLDGGLGAGKTVFTKGFAEGLGINEPVCSPTFTIMQVYDEGRIPLYHFDVYRIGDVSEMDDICYEDFFFGNGVCIVEWSCIVEEILPRNARRINIEKDLEKGFDYRKITVEDK